jgi:hypothetical protein
MLARARDLVGELRGVPPLPAAAAATERRIRPIGSALQTRCVTARQGACTASTGTPKRSASRATAATSWLIGSIHTINSTPSYPSSAASSNATRADSG